jgi:hypothetical protein
MNHNQAVPLITLQHADQIDKLVPYLGKNVMYTLATPLLLGIGFMIA